MRYVIYGAGGVGGSLGAQLHQAGRDVVLIARGAHLEALRTRGLTYHTPEGTEHLKLPVVSGPKEAGIDEDDVVVLAMKTQDTYRALGDLCASTSGTAGVFCAQNGVFNERLALRSQPRVYGMAVWIPATFIEPGVVFNHSRGALLDVGRVPDGVDALASRVVDDLREAGFSATLRERILYWKHTKLLANLVSALDAICGGREGLEDVCSQLRREAEACYRAAGIDYASEEEYRERLMAAARLMGTIDGAQRRAGSGVQSLSRGMGSIETDYINGEIALLGRLHGVPTPANEAVRAAANELARSGAAPGALKPDTLRARIRSLGGR